MNKYKGIILFVIVLVSIISVILVNVNFDVKREENSEKYIEEKTISKPEGIEAYTLNGEKTNKEFNDLINNYVLDKITCRNGTIATYSKATNEVSLSNIHMPDYCTMNFRYTIYGKLLADNTTIKTRTDFSTVFTEINTGTLYKSTESIVGSTPKEVYYFAGNAQNNWVKFAGFYWRIIRTNHDGSVRMLYAGTSPDTTEGYIGTSAFNTEFNSPKYVGYMYGNSDTTPEEARTNTNDSTIKTYIDNWYENNLTTYTNYLSNDAAYCNDRNEQDEGSYNLGDTTFYFASRYRAYTSFVPTYDCTTSADAFSASNANAKLTYPIALMTVDEVMYAGGKSNTSLTSPYAWFYLNSEGESITGGYWWWIMSPVYWYTNIAHVLNVGNNVYPGYIAAAKVNTTPVVRPVISVKSCALWKSGDGSAETPYEISTTSGC